MQTIVDIYIYAVRPGVGRFRYTYAFILLSSLGHDAFTTRYIGATLCPVFMTI